MTSTSLRNRPTTRRSTDRSTSVDLLAWLPALLCAVALLCSSSAFADGTGDDAVENDPTVSADIEDLDIPSDEEIEAELARLKAVDQTNSSKENIEDILTAIGSQVPDDLEPYKEPASDPSELSKIGSISPFREAPTGQELPEEIPLGRNSAYYPRAIPHSHYCWNASDMFSNPLYFEDVNLERYGYSYPFLMQPFMSVGKFSTQLALLPYQMVNNPIRKQVYHVGYYRPGEWAPRLWYQVPFNLKAATVQAGAVTGMIFLIP